MINSESQEILCYEDATSYLTNYINYDKTNQETLEQLENRVKKLEIIIYYFTENQKESWLDIILNFFLN
jgi:hypothetical protein